jgi:hypothetical protein
MKITLTLVELEALKAIVSYALTHLDEVMEHGDVEILDKTVRALEDKLYKS